MQGLFLDGSQMPDPLSLADFPRIKSQSVPVTIYVKKVVSSIICSIQHLFVDVATLDVDM